MVLLHLNKVRLNGKKNFRGIGRRFSLFGFFLSGSSFRKARDSDSTITIRFDQKDMRRKEVERIGVRERERERLRESGKFWESFDVSRSANNRPFPLVVEYQ